MKTLFLSDLDGTLLNRQRMLSPKTAAALNRLIDQGMLFSVATARSLWSAKPLIGALHLNCPAIFHNGTFVMEPWSHKILSAVSFTKRQQQLVRTVCKKHGISPVCYAVLDGRERLSFRAGDHHPGMAHYLALRQGDVRMREVFSEQEQYEGDAYYFTCIGEQEELFPVYEELSPLEEFRCVFQQELDRPEYWLEIMPKKAGKDSGLLKLKEILCCDRVVAFGDALNDLPMFQAADECYAVANAALALKEAATGVIGSNEENGVANWLVKRFSQQ